MRVDAEVLGGVSIVGGGGGNGVLLCLLRHLFLGVVLWFRSVLIVVSDRRAVQSGKWRMVQVVGLDVHSEVQIALFLRLESLELSDYCCPVASRVARLVELDFCILHRRAAFVVFCSQFYEAEEQSPSVSA